MGLGSLGMGEVIIIFLVILVFFGAKRLPDLAKGLGKGIREFKDALNNVQNDIQIEDKTDASKSNKQETKNKEAE